VGETLGPYDLLDELGRGGMGVVYRAVHRPTGVVRALKVLDHAPDAEAMERFRREAAALARAQGEGVVPVHDLGVAGGRLFFAMPLFDGGSLDKRLARAGPLAWREACALTLEVARALVRCHAVGLVHRDIKPANLLFDASGRVYLADFGCVRDLAAPQLTQTGAMLGTPLYMAPELFAGAKADPRADVYSLGAVLYQLVVGHAPYRGTSPVQVMALALAGQRAPLPASAPRALDALIAAALAHEPDGRIASASELAARLERLLGGEERRAWTMPALVLIAAAAVVCALVGVGVATWVNAPPAPGSVPTASPRPSRPPAPASAPKDEYARARAALGRSYPRDRDLLLALDAALPATPATVDSALAAQIVSAVWPGDDPVLASEGFVMAARVDDAVAQPPGLVERLERTLFEPGAPVDVVVALLRLGRRPPARLVVRYEDALRARVADGGGWADKLALAHVLLEHASDVAGKVPEATVAKMYALGQELGLEVDRLRLPRGARAAARFAVLEPQARGHAGERGPLELAYLTEFADDLDVPERAYVNAADYALDRGNLDWARPLIRNALRVEAEPTVGSDHDVDFVRRPGRPWASPALHRRDRAELARLVGVLQILDAGVEPRTILEGLRPTGRETVARHLERAGRPDVAKRAREAMAALGDPLPPR
jgi:serine/threonine-protein kinase